MVDKIISSKDYEFIHEVIGPQLQEERVEALMGSIKKNYWIKYCIINDGKANTNRKNIVLIPGFGSGWTGSTRLVYEIVKLGYQVIAISPYGYGNSSNPFTGSPKIDDDFTCERGDLRLWHWEIFGKEKLHYVGHSMGAEIITTLAGGNPELVASLTLLNSAGFEQKNIFKLALDFGLNGFEHYRTFRDDPIWKELQKFFPKQKSPFTPDRLLQRLSEGRRTCKKIMPSLIRKIKGRVPILCISGERDYVFPYQEMIAELDSIKVLSGSYHNTTMFGAEKTAKEIHEFISAI